MSFNNILTNKTWIAFLFMAFVITTATTSCERNKCKIRGIECQNDGTCFDGECNCPAGWTGTLCDTAESFKYNGTYAGIRVYDNGYATGDTLSIINQTNNTILLEPNTVIPLKANVQNNQFFVPKANFLNYVISGSGVLNQDRLSMTVVYDSVINGVKLSSWKYTFSGDRLK